MFQMSSASEHTSNISLLRSVFVENLDLLVVASEDNNICKLMQGWGLDVLAEEGWGHTV